MRKTGRQPGFRLSMESRAKIGASVRATVAASMRWRPPPGYEREYVRLRGDVGAAEAKRIVDADVAHTRARRPMTTNHAGHDGG